MLSAFFVVGDEIVAWIWVFSSFPALPEEAVLCDQSTQTQSCLLDLC